jgi:hypothetical protein
MCSASTGVAATTLLGSTGLFKENSSPRIPRLGSEPRAAARIDASPIYRFGWRGGFPVPG